MNRILRLLILSDFFFWTGLGFVGPILAIYINDDIQNSTLGLTGLAVSIFWIMKALVALLVSRYTDHENGNWHKLTTMVIGYIIAFLSPFGFLFAKDIVDIIFIQFIFGTGMGMAYPGWMTIFSRFLETGKEGFAWSLDGAGIGLGNSAAIAVSGFVAEYFGFTALFLLTIGFNFLSLLCILMLFFKYREEILSKKHKLRYIAGRLFGV